MQIYIPTRGRINNQATWDFLKHSDIIDYVTLVCPPEEVADHEERNRRAIARPVNGINKVRQWICEMAPDPHIIMCDDDLGFFVRADPKAWNLKPASNSDLVDIFSRIHNILVADGLAHGGLTPRQMNNVHFPEVYISNGKMNAVHAVNRDILAKENIKYTDVDIMEDYYVTLSLFTKGYANKLVCDAAWDQKGVSGAAGGCSTYRTSELQSQGAQDLADIFPDFVKVVEKTPKGGWGGGMTTRKDVRIQWKKAYESSQKGS